MKRGQKYLVIPPSHHKNLSVTSRRTAHSISLINEKNTLLRQIASMSNLVQKAALEQLLSQVKSKIKLLRRAENGRKKRWKFKKAQAAFRSNPYRAEKSLLDPNCSIIKELFYPIYSVQRALIDLLKYKLYFPFTPAHFCQLM